MGLWNSEDVFPIIARIIRELHEKHGGFIQHRAIEVEMLQDASARKLIRAVHGKRVAKKTPQWEAMAMVAGFSKGYPKSVYENEFERTRDRGYAYKPRKLSAKLINPDEVQRNSPTLSSGEPASNPDWTRDELILALNLYLKYRHKPPGKESPEILELSRVLNQLGEKLFPPEDRADTFRNMNGVYMKLMNFRRLDPQYTSGGK